jgi:hypothetical protein
MTNFGNVDAEGLAALGRVVNLCLPSRPCNRKSCVRCTERVRQDALESADIEAELWGEAE